MALQTIEEHWNGYAAMVLPTTAGPVQRAETKQAFFAGAWAMFSAVEEIGLPHISEAEGDAYLEARREECLQFKRQIMKRYTETN